MSAAAQPLVDCALRYVSRDSVARSVIERLEQSPTPHHIAINHRGDDSYQLDSRTIRWDPTSAMLTSRGGRQSPALGLVHEMDHATMGDRGFMMLASIPDPRFDNLEERRVILGSERHEARTLHEGTRSDHDGRLYHVDSPVDR